MTGYTTREAAELLDLRPSEVRRWARAGVLDPTRGPRSEYRFSFQDLVLLRTARGLRDAHVPPRRIRRALQELRRTLPADRSLAAVRIAAEGERVLVRQGETVWEPESGQVHFQFAVAELAREAAPVVRRATAAARAAGDDGPDAEGWFELGCEAEYADPEEAMDAYRRALEADPDHADARVNLGRLLQEAGALEDAVAQYRRALVASPAHATAAYNLGVALEELDRPDAAREAYEDALRADPALADAHYNLAGLHERRGDEAAALRHLRYYRDLSGP